MCIGLDPGNRWDLNQSWIDNGFMPDSLNPLAESVESTVLVTGPCLGTHNGSCICVIFLNSEVSILDMCM